MMDNAILNRVLQHYPAGVRPTRIVPLGGAGGFSGASFWRLETPAGELCLRRWPPEHPTEERLAEQHAVLEHVWRQGFTLLPRPLTTSAGTTFVQLDAHLWELTAWLPGKADYRDSPGVARLRAAMEALARFHVAAATFPGQPAAAAPSPGLAQRLELLRQLSAHECDAIEARIGAGGAGTTSGARGATTHQWPELADRARRLLPLFRTVAPRIERELAGAAQMPLVQQPAIRDIWHDHVLFEGDRVSGIIDFGAMRTESVAGDVARLLGGLALDDIDTWRVGLAAYRAIRPLAVDERRAVAVFDRSATLLSGMNWLRWILLEGRRFDDRPRVLARLDETLARLEHLARAIAPRST